MPQRQAAREHGADLAVPSERMRPHHLELAAHQAAFHELVREQEPELVAGADPDAADRPSLGAGDDIRHLDASDRVIEMEGHPKLGGEPRGQAGDDFARVDAHFAG